MNASATVKLFRYPLAASFVITLLGMTLAAPAQAGDPDDDWGLPGQQNAAPAENGMDDTDDDASAATAGSDIRTYATAQEVALATVGKILVDRPDHEHTGVAQSQQPALAEVAAEDASAPLAVELLDDGVRVQGWGRIQLSDSLTARLEKPAEALISEAWLVIDDGSLTLLDLAQAAQGGSVPAGALDSIPLGDLQSMDLAQFQQLVLEQGQILDQLGPDGLPVAYHVSVLVVSLDVLGDLHAVGVRSGLQSGPLEIVAR